MTPEQLKKIPFHMVAHLSMEHENALTYANEDGRLSFCDHTIKRGDGTFGRTYRHWRIDNKVFKTKDKFLEALKNYNP